MAGRVSGGPDLDAFLSRWASELPKPADRKQKRPVEESKERTQKTKKTKTQQDGDSNNMASSATSFAGIFDSRQRHSALRSIQPSLAPEDLIQPDEDNPRKFVIGLDYGTTFTSVSYSIHPLDEDPLRAFPWEVKSITNWPKAAASRKQVPTEIWYSSVPIDRKPGKGSVLQQLNSGDSSIKRAITTASSNPQEDTTDEEDDPSLDDETSAELLWGYVVPFQKYVVNTGRDPVGLIRHAKSKLLDTSYTENDRLKLDPQLGELLSKGIIRKFGKEGSTESRDIQDVISDFLAEVFAHTKSQLTMLHGFSDRCPVQFVVTVPTIWCPQSSRILQAAMQDALKTAAFGVCSSGVIENLFIISEPEAAATYIIQSNSSKLLIGETFIVLDCGGGTVDATTYTVDSSYPLRLGREEVEPGGDNCGGSYLNEAFKNLLEDRLKNESYLFHHGETRQSIVGRLIPSFEDDLKRNVDVLGGVRPHDIHILGLRGDEERDPKQGTTRHFRHNGLTMRKRDYEYIFNPILERVEKVLATQLKLTFQKQKPVKKVFLVGGFGEAPSLRSHLRNYLSEVSDAIKQKIELIEDNMHSSETAVSVGAVLRALNMDKGPDRIIQSSYGFLRTEPYEPKVFPAHKEAEPDLDDIDGEYYLQTIVYFMKKGKTVPSKHEFTFQAHHTFDVKKERFLCEEVLYVSDFATESHYTRTHSKNRGIQVAGKILVDMTWLRDQKVIKPIDPEIGSNGMRHYKVEYELVAIVEGRNLRYEARYPAGGEVQKSRQVSIAAAFRPGTK